MKLLVALGNPGEYYKRTRHNIGFLVVERVAQEHKIRFSRNKFHSIIGEGNIDGQKVALSKPQTYMNLCGEVVKKLIANYGIGPERLIVIHDDLDMEFGKIKIKEKGGHGGHNGVRSIISALRAEDFVRLKVGIGRPKNGQRVKDYVLSSFDSYQSGFLPELLLLGEKAMVCLLTQGVQAAMNEFNRQNCTSVRE